MTDLTIREAQTPRYLTAPTSADLATLVTRRDELRAAGLTRLVHVDLTHFYFQIAPETVEEIRAGAVPHTFSVARWA